jgi:cell division septation protein DedD
MAETVSRNATKAPESRRRKPRLVGIYTQIMMTRQVPLSIVNVGDNVKQTLEKSIAAAVEGRCIVEGFVKPGSVRVVSYSSGMLRGSDVFYDVIIECQTCCPVEGMNIDCVAKTITESAGIRAEVEEEPSPVVIFLARDHHYTNKAFTNVKVGDKIKVRVLGQRFELNDKYVSVIAELIEDKGELRRFATTKPANAKPANAKPANAKPADAKPADAKQTTAKATKRKPKLVMKE